MLRCWLLIAALALLCSCGTSPPVYPLTVAGGYRLYRENVVAKEKIPQIIPAAGLIRVVQLVYDASNGIQLTVFETKSYTVALEAMQTWRPQDGKHATQMGRYFVIAQGEKPDPASIKAFLADFQKQLK